jgi:RNA polymerase sigma-70 factor (ECF subfamily)
MPRPLGSRRSDGERLDHYNDCATRRRVPSSGRLGARLDQGNASTGEENAGIAGEDADLPARVLEPEDEAAARRAEDHALIRRAQKGDEAAFEALVERHRARAWRVARGLVGSEEDAQDLVHEAFLRVFRSLASFDFDHGFTTWLYRIVTNLAIDHLRRRRAAISTTAQNEDEGDLDLADDAGPGPAAGLEREDLAREVRACLASLAPHFQSVLQLREMEGLPCTEIARIVGATHVTVRWRLHRGRKLFQEEWDRRSRLLATSGGRSLAAGTLPSGAQRVKSNTGGEADVTSPVEDQEEALE